MMPQTSTSITASARAVGPKGCCPRFDPRPWDRHEIVWKDRPFVKRHARCVMHIPLDMGRNIREARALIDAAGVSPTQPLVLIDEVSPWHAEVYVEATGAVPGAEVAWLSGTFITKVFDGSYREAPSWASEMTAYVAGRGRTLKKLYVGPTTCPACAKTFGENYVVMFALVEG